MTAVVAFVTCADLPDLDDDDRLALEPLAALDIAVEPVIWNDPAVDWTRFEVVVLRSPWDYAPRRDEFVAWANSVPQLANDAVTVTWNTDKRYLVDLAEAGVPIVPTTWVSPGSEPWEPPTVGEYVVKPSVSAGSKDTGRYDFSIPEHRELATAHVSRLTDAGRAVMIQPYLTAVDTYGETAMIFIGGVFSHAIRKGPMLDGPDLGVPGLYKPEAITAREPSAAEHAVAARVLSALPGHIGTPLYARVDLIPGWDGTPMLVELELTEPSLFFDHAPSAPGRFAAAVSTLIA